MTPGDVPTGWKSITLGELFTEDQLKEVARIIRESPDEFQATLKLKPFLRGLRDQLETKGIHPEFLSHAIPFYLKAETFRDGPR